MTDLADVAELIRSAGLRVSLRSTGPLHVGEIAIELGGGGHEFMAGFVSEASIPETIEAVRTRVEARSAS